MPTHEEYKAYDAKQCARVVSKIAATQRGRETLGALAPLAAIVPTLDRETVKQLRRLFAYVIMNEIPGEVAELLRPYSDCHYCKTEEATA